MRNTFHQTSILLVFGLCNLFLFGQQNDSINTPFLKGKWLTGLSGNVSSRNIEYVNDPGVAKIRTNQFGLNISTGRFIKNRILFGLLVEGNRSHTVGMVESEQEILFLGPTFNFYLSDNKIGSLFFNTSVGYVRTWNNLTFMEGGIENTITSTGNGAGTKLGLGYSYVMNESAVFTLTLTANNYLVESKGTIQPSGVQSIERALASDLIFTFGFNVLLDKFFF